MKLKHINLYEENNYQLKPSLEKFLNKRIKGTWKLNNELVDIDGDFDPAYYNLSQKSLKKIKFGNVSGYFNASVPNLDGIPKYTKGALVLLVTESLESLIGSPNNVGSFEIEMDNSELKSLIGGPKIVTGIGKEARVPGKNAKGSYKIDGFNGKNFKGAPEHVLGNFEMKTTGNKISLIGGPKKVGGSYRIYADINDCIDFDAIPESFGSDINNVFNHFLPEFSIGEFYMYNVRVQSISDLLDVFINPYEHLHSSDKDNIEDNIDNWKSNFLKIFGHRIINEINHQIKITPGKFIMLLKSIWNDENFKEVRKNIIIPEKYKEQLDILSDLDELGF